MSPTPGTPRSSGDVAALVHSLEVHQAELEEQNQQLLAANEELRRSNQALAVARDRYGALHDLAPVALVTLDTGGMVVDANAAAEALLRTPRVRLIDRRFVGFVAEPARVAFQTLVRTVFLTGGVRRADTVLTPADDAAIDVEIDGALLQRDDDRRAHVLLALVDVTTRNRAAEAQRLESLGVLAGGIAHDFNNLLTIVLAATDYAEHVLGTDSKVGRVLGEASQAARQAGALAHQMLAYSGKVSTPTHAVDPVALVRELEPLLRATAKATPLRLEIGDAVPWIHGDEAQLRQIVLNLAINASEAMLGRDGAITVAVRVEGTQIVLEVRDEGTGMDEATQARIFEPYFSTKFVGRGLGLAVVQGIVRAHGGTITVASELERSTTFRVSLPAVAPGTTRGRPLPPIETPWRGAGTVLLVDDERLVRRAFARLIEGFGVEVLTAADGVEAVEAIRGEAASVDLVLMDLTMPRMGGVAAAREIHELRADLPIVLVTGYGEIPAEASAEFAGVLPKPVDLAALEQTLRRFLPAAPRAI